MLNKFVGIPYVNHGRDYDACDCWGLVYLWYRDVLKTPVPSYEAEMAGLLLRPKEVAPVLIAECDANWQEVTIPREGDVVLMRHGHLHNHVGIYINSRRILHTEHEGCYSLLDRLDAPHNNKRIVGYYRLANAD